MKIAGRFFKRTRRKFFLCSIITIFALTILQMDLTPEFPWSYSANVSCYFIHPNYSLPILNDKVSLPPRSIFFHEASCHGNLTSRQSCAIESAAQAHPKWQIHVLFSGPVMLEDLNEATLMQLKKLKNIKFWRIDVENLAKETPLENKMRVILGRCYWDSERISDVLKYLILYKWGGIFIDSDVVLTRPLGALARNWAARNNDEGVAEGILALSKDSAGRNIVNAAMRHVQLNYKKGDWCDNNPTVITRVLQNFCSTTDVIYMSSATCNGFEVYGQQFFYPIERQRVREYFVPGELRIHNAYMYHLWGKLSSAYKISSSSPYAKLARRYCPLSFKLF